MKTQSSAVELSIPLDEQEKDLLTALIDPRSSVTTIIPASIDKKELLNNLSICCRAADWADKTTRKIGPLIGRILLVAEGNEEVYKSVGCINFETFITDYVYGKLKYSRSSCYAWMRIVKSNPSLSQEKLNELGTEKLTLLSRFTKETDPSYPKHLAAARQAKNTQDFQKHIYASGLQQRGEDHKTVITIEAVPNVGKHWREFKSSPRVQATVGSQDDGLIFDAMLGECSGWMSGDGKPELADKPKVVVTVGVRYVWACEKCGATGIVPGGYSGKTIRDLRNYIHDAHVEAGKDCTENALDLDLIPSDGDPDIDTTVADEQPPEIEG